MTGFITRRAHAALAAHAAATGITLRACDSDNTLLAGMMQAAAEACLHEANECLAALRAIGDEHPSCDGILRGNADIDLLLAEQHGGVQ